MKKTFYSFTLIIALIGIAKFFSFSSNELADDQSFMNHFNSKYSIFALPKPTAQMDFCGERVPLENPDIWERFDKELLKNTYWQSNTLLLHKRAHKYFPIIEPILAEYQVPDDFKYLALIESGLENVISPAGATGFWQIMKGTAKEFDMEVNSEIDERYHLEKSTILACKFLSAGKEKFGSWTLAAAAYNMGRTGLQKQMNIQKANNYYDLLLNNETSRYVFRILALKNIIEDPKHYGFHLRDKDLYQHVPTYSVSVDSAVSNWSDFAKKHDINYKILKRYNPWLRKNYLTNSKRKVYKIDIPQKGYYTFQPSKPTESIQLSK
ncbi:MAG: murein transglycosylase [Flavobacteriales bacterium]|nr:murein transglycosylase [Flavobacteriales bacterium]|tara:strand:- start:3935 stop:4903 length:969 start_codon:yes stop_codon:yes gene_type:complete